MWLHLILIIADQKVINTEINIKFNQQEIETVIFENKKKQEVVKPVTKPNIGSPETSDTSIAGYTISSMVAVGSLVFINKKRKNK